jgi:phage-related holin
MLAGIFTIGFNLFFTPKITAVLVVFGLVIFDFVTGVIKAKIKGNARTSEGYRKTLKKIPGYIIIPVVLWLAGVLCKTYIQPDASTDSETIARISKILKSASGWVLIFIVFIETKSIFENLYEIDKTSPFNRFFIKPILTILSFGIENNPLKTAADKLRKDNKDIAEKLLIDQAADAAILKIEGDASKEKKDIDNQKS